MGLVFPIFQHAFEKVKANKKTLVRVSAAKLDRIRLNWKFEKNNSG